jgi:hypothetical protein
MPGQPERREECMLHESRIDDIANEIHKHGGWWKLIGGSMGVACTLLGWFGNSINVKLDSIELLLSADKIAIAELKKDVHAIEVRIDNIERRHEHLDQNGIVKKIR